MPTTPTSTRTICRIIIPQIGENLLPKYHGSWDEEGDPMPENVLRLSEIFFRDLIAGTFGLQHLDNFIGKVSDPGGPEGSARRKDPRSADDLQSGKGDQQLHAENLRTHNLIHLGNKGFNLVVLAGTDQPVPPAFIITTEVFRCWAVLREFDRAREEFMRRVRTAVTSIEQLTGRVFGDRTTPCSSRSAAGRRSRCRA
jgi:pyruvate, orthophosphate dikinase